MNIRSVFKKALILGVITAILPVGALAQTSQDYENRLREEEAKLQEEVNVLSKEVSSLQGQKSTIEQAIALIDAQIREAQAKIKLRTLTIEGLTKDIGVKTRSIAELEGKLERGRESLANLVRRTNQNDSVSLPLILLAQGPISDFFVNVDSLQVIKGTLAETVDEVREFKGKTEAEKSTLESRKIKETDARKAIEAEKKTVESKKAEQAELLKIKNGQLKTYQQWVADKQIRINQIRSALFELRGAEGIPFGDAYDFAREASQKTGVRPAFILGILRQESNLGKNVGQCYLVDPTTGSGKGKNTGTIFKNVMKPDRDVVPFLRLVEKLGRDPFGTSVSCPQSVGYGGAMGPSQFIASTWSGYASKLADLLGVETADPWIPKHAIMATALFVKDLGAGRGGYSAEQEAAARYYAGGRWKTLGLGYASSVLSYAAAFQEQIDYITGN